MVPPFTAALDHIRLMETRIRTQEAAIEQLKQAGQDTSQAVAKLNLLRSALEEMRLQIARLIPTEEQVADPIWAFALRSPRRQHKKNA
jgi:hypothetical protein